MAKHKGNHADSVIIKKVINVAGGHHGGSWKVAYADFVTAMMAFFLLLWLLAVTTPDQRTGIAEYFTPTFGLTDSKGIGFQGGETPDETGHSHTTLSQPGLVAGQVKQGTIPRPPQPESMSQEENDDSGTPVMGQSQAEDQATKDTKAAAQETDKKSDKDDSEVLKKAAESIAQIFEQNPDLQQLRKNIIVTNTPEGLKIDVVDDPKHPLFAPGTATMTDTGRLMLKAISGVVLKTRNQISIAGHTERLSYPAGATYTAWELSSDRANAARRYMSESLSEPGRVAKVTGMADKEMLLPKEPENPRNRRISITLLRNTQIAPANAPASRDLLTVPEVDTGAIKPPPAPPPAKAKEPEAPPVPPSSIFHPKGAQEKTGNEPNTSSGFDIPRNMQKAAPAAPQDSAPVAPVAPITLQQTAPDSVFVPDADQPAAKGE